MAQTPYPAETIRIVSPFAAGGGTDIMARLFAQRLQADWKTNAIVEVKAGGGGNIGTEMVARARPDGHTLLVTTNATIVINPQLPGSQTRYDPVKDLTPISLLASVPLALVVPAAFPADTFEGFVAYAKAHPGVMNCGSSGVGGSAHLALEQLKLMAGLDITHVTYRGSGQSLTALLGGHVDCLFVSMLTVVPMVKQGRLRALAISSLERNSAMPDLPTVAEFPGFEGFESDLWYGLLAPAGTSPAIVQRLYAEVREMIADPTVRTRLEATGAILVGDTPKEFAARIQTDLKKWADVIARAKIMDAQ
ncbi:Bug family tripartite tricarboxylate transporter substrate binding protein [Aquabacter spiritensis]|nr:tripartite tricarboxylate transporter substrate binding protein [Aquabacter spiritensis]